MSLLTGNVITQREPLRKVRKLIFTDHYIVGLSYQLLYTYTYTHTHTHTMSESIEVIVHALAEVLDSYAANPAILKNNLFAMGSMQELYDYALLTGSQMLYDIYLVLDRFGLSTSDVSFLYTAVCSNMRTNILDRVRHNIVHKPIKEERVGQRDLAAFMQNPESVPIKLKRSDQSVRIRTQENIETRVLSEVKGNPLCCWYDWDVGYVLCNNPQGRCEQLLRSSPPRSNASPRSNRSTGGTRPNARCYSIDSSDSESSSSESDSDSDSDSCCFESDCSCCSSDSDSDSCDDRRPARRRPARRPAARRAPATTRRRNAY